MTDAFGPYQRGNRDGLLSFALWCEEQAIVYDKDVVRQERLFDKQGSEQGRHNLSRLLASSRGQASAFRYAALCARRQAEALPIDPVEGDPENDR